MTTIHICRGVNRRYVAQVRSPGARRWETKLRTIHYRKAVLAMASGFCGGNYKRGRVLFLADYYDPVVVTEMCK